MQLKSINANPGIAYGAYLEKILVDRLCRHFGKCSVIVVREYETGNNECISIYNDIRIDGPIVMLVTTDSPLNV